MCSDEVARAGLQLADFPPELWVELDQMLPPFYSRHNPLDMVASAGGDVGPKIVSLVAECDTVDAVIVLSCLGVPSTGASERAAGSDDGEFAGLSVWETSFMAVMADLMEKTGKPIINVPDTPIRGSVFDFGRKYKTIVLGTPQAAARALDRMEWYGAYRRANGAD